MKKITLLAVVMVVVNLGFLNAQTEKGKVLLGVSSSHNLAGSSSLMSFGFASIKSKSDAEGFEESESAKYTNFNLSPKVGYFIIDNLALGLDLNLGFAKSKDRIYSSEYSETLFSAGPFIRYYASKSKVLPFVEISGSFGSLNEMISYGDNSFFEDREDRSSVVVFGGGIGLAAPLGDRVTFDVLAGYRSMTLKSKDNNADNYRLVLGTLGINIGLTLFLGSMTADNK